MFNVKTVFWELAKFSVLASNWLSLFLTSAIGDFSSFFETSWSSKVWMRSENIKYYNHLGGIQYVRANFVDKDSITQHMYILDFKMPLEPNCACGIPFNYLCCALPFLRWRTVFLHETAVGPRVWSTTVVVAPLGTQIDRFSSATSRFQPQFHTCISMKNW